MISISITVELLHYYWISHGGAGLDKMSNDRTTSASPEVKGLFVWSTLVPLTVNGTNFVKTPNTQSIVGTLIPRNIEVSTVPLTFCTITNQFDKKINLIKINCQAIDFASMRSPKIPLNDLQHHQRI
jgi:hypothetical protein